MLFNILYAGSLNSENKNHSSSTSTTSAATINRSSSIRKDSMHRLDLLYDALTT